MNQNDQAIEQEIQAQAYTGPLRRRSDAIEVATRVVEDVPVLANSEEAAP